MGPRKRRNHKPSHWCGSIEDAATRGTLYEYGEQSPLFIKTSVHLIGSNCNFYFRYIWFLLNERIYFFWGFLLLFHLLCSFMDIKLVRGNLGQPDCFLIHSVESLDASGRPAWLGCTFCPYCAFHMDRILEIWTRRTSSFFSHSLWYSGSSVCLFM